MLSFLKKKSKSGTGEKGLPPSLRSKIMRRTTIGVIVLINIILIIGLFGYFTIFANLPNPATLKDYRSVALSTHIYDRNGKLLYEVYKDQNRTPVKLKDLYPYVFQSTIAIEDKDFYKHSGVSLVSGVLRALRETLFNKSFQGGSTLTQQLVKTALLTPERTIQRKIKEIILAVWTEKLYTKDQILELYLNQVPYGGSSYGIEEASKTFFGKHAKDLTLSEAALLAGLPQAPSLYSPYLNEDYALSRRNDVLRKMKEQDYITDAQYQEAVQTELKVIPPKVAIKAPHFVFYVKSELEKQFGTHEVEEGGLNVTTTLDMEVQDEAEKILKEELDKVKYLNVSNGAVLVTRPPTGEILAMVGSVDYFATPSGSFNVTTAQRQPGSSIKPINFAIGIDRKIVTPATIFLDVPTCFSAPGQAKSYCPVNYDGSFHGPVSLRFALANSYNIPAVKMLALNGVTNFVASASAFTISSFKDPSRYGLSLTLGGGEVTMIEMSQAFSAFANQGVPKRLQPLLLVQNRYGADIYRNEDANIVPDVKKPLSPPRGLSIRGKHAISKETAFLISHILSDNGARVNAFGPNSYLVVPKRTVSVKTGTTDDKRDNWTIGYTANFLTTVWVGNNNNSPMNPALSSGVTGAAPIWNRIMSYLLKNQPDLPPVKPDSVIGINTCASTGAAAPKPNPDDPNAQAAAAACSPRFEYIIRGTEKIAGANASRASVPVNKDIDKVAKPGDVNVENRDKTIIKDQFSQYCVDCNHDGEGQPTPVPVP